MKFSKLGIVNIVIIAFFVTAGSIVGCGKKEDLPPTTMVECTVDESRYTVSDNYKITLKAIDPVYYISDLESIIKNNANHKIYVLGYDSVNNTNYYTSLA